MDGLASGGDGRNGEKAVEILKSELTLVKRLQKEVFWCLFLNVMPTHLGHIEVVTDVFTLSKWHE